MNVKLLRSATLSLGVAAGAMLAVGFFANGVAAADAADLWWYPDPSTSYNGSFGPFGIQLTGPGDLDGYNTLPPFYTDELPDALQANLSVTEIGPRDAINYWLDTFDITDGNAAIGIPTGSTISSVYDLDTGEAVQFVYVPHAEFFGLLPSITESIFTAGGETSFSFDFWPLPTL
jgi:hypothetical protein